jgi:thiol-disulfide isomerase/thioredoxin
MKTGIRLAGSLLLLCAAAIACAQEASKSAGAILTLNDLSNQPQNLSQYRGRIVVLNFWATWCVPCREEMPLLVDLHKRYVGRGVQVIAASADESSTQPRIPDFIKKLKLNFPVWIGATTLDMKRLGLGEELPATAIIDRDGQIVGRILGPVEKDDLQNRIEWLLGDRGPPAPQAVVNNIEKLKHQHPAGEEHHEHGGVGVEGASTVPS